MKRIAAQLKRRGLKTFAQELIDILPDLPQQLLEPDVKTPMPGRRQDRFPKSPVGPLSYDKYQEMDRRGQGPGPQPGCSPVDKCMCTMCGESFAKEPGVRCVDYVCPTCNIPLMRDLQGILPPNVYAKVVKRIRAKK